MGERLHAQLVLASCGVVLASIAVGLLTPEIKAYRWHHIRDPWVGCNQGVLMFAAILPGANLEEKRSAKCGPDPTAGMEIPQR